MPGIIALLGYFLTIHLIVRFKPEYGPRRVRVGSKVRLNLFKSIWKIVVIFLLVIGGIYLGWFTPTEGAAVGTAGTASLAFFYENFWFKRIARSD